MVRENHRPRWRDWSPCRSLPGRQACKGLSAMAPAGAGRRASVAGTVPLRHGWRQPARPQPGRATFGQPFGGSSTATIANVCGRRNSPTSNRRHATVFSGRSGEGTTPVQRRAASREPCIATPGQGVDPSGRPLHPIRRPLGGRRDCHPIVVARIRENQQRQSRDPSLAAYFSVRNSSSPSF